MLQQPTKFEIRRRHTFGFSINQPGDFDLWPFDLELGAHYCSCGGQPSYQFWCFRDFSFRSWFMSQHLLEGPRDLATLTFNLGGHDVCPWYGSSCVICVPSLKFIGLPVIISIIIINEEIRVTLSRNAAAALYIHSTEVIKRYIVNRTCVLMHREKV